LAHGWLLSCRESNLVETIWQAKIDVHLFS
jgi:hypothetical protein